MLTNAALRPADLAVPVKILDAPPKVVPQGIKEPFLAWHSWDRWQVADRDGQMHRVKTLSYTASWKDIWQNIKQGGVVLLVKAGEPCGILDNEIILQALLENYQQLQAITNALLDVTDEAITIIDEDSIVKVWNNRAEQFYDIKQEDIIGQSIDNFYIGLAAAEQLENILIDLNEEVRNQHSQLASGAQVLINTAPIIVNNQVIGAIAAEREALPAAPSSGELADELARTQTQVRDLQAEVDTLEQSAAKLAQAQGQIDSLQAEIDTLKQAAAVSYSAEPKYVAALAESPSSIEVLNQSLLTEDGSPQDGNLSNLTDKLEREAILQVLEKTANDRSKAAKLLGIPRSTLYYKLNKHGIDTK